MEVNLTDLFRTQPAYILWLIVGLGCIAIAMVIAEPTTAALGFAALITAIAAISVPNFGAQMFIWGLLSVCLAIIFRGLVPRSARELQPSTEGRVSQTIPVGGEGEVFYDGTYWRAQGQPSDLMLPEGTKVYILRREGNTLTVMPIAPPENSISDR